MPLTVSGPSLALISLHDSAGSSGMEPRGTVEQTFLFRQLTMMRMFTDKEHITYTSHSV